jgi:hypothetical protein
MQLIDYPKGELSITRENGSEPSDLRAKTRQSSDLQGVARELSPQGIQRRNPDVIRVIRWRDAWQQPSATQESGSEIRRSIENRDIVRSWEVRFPIVESGETRFPDRIRPSIVRDACQEVPGSRGSGNQIFKDKETSSLGIAIRDIPTVT